MDKIRFKQSFEKEFSADRIKNSIGTLSEKTLHAVLKQYFDGDESHHEIKVGSYVADIVNEKGIIEIQTRNFNKLRNKLERFFGCFSGNHCISCRKDQMAYVDRRGDRGYYA